MTWALTLVLVAVLVVSVLGIVVVGSLLDDPLDRRQRPTVREPAPAGGDNLLPGDHESGDA